MTVPRLLQRVSVPVMTAWSSCVLVASAANEEAGNEKPWPILEGAMKTVASQVGIQSHIEDRQTEPSSMHKEPIMISSFIRPVPVIINPLETPHIVRATDGPARRNPDADGVSSFTA